MAVGLRRPLVSLSGFALLAALGCSGRPLPLQAVAGTTIGLAISGETNLLAYGTADFADVQRGALGVDFMQGSTVVAGPVGLRLATRLVPDTASPAGLAGSVGGATTLGLHQAVALLDVPVSLPAPQTYTLRLRRYRDATLTTVVDEGPTESTLWTLDVKPGDGAPHFTPFEGELGPIDAAYIAELVPYPKLVLTLPSATAAATVQIRFPTAAVEIRGALVRRKVGQASLVTFELVDSDSVRLHYVNPAADTSALELVFANTAAIYAPVLYSQFAYESGAFYDADGAPIAPSASYSPITANAIR
jgi:hypothetical protein